MLSAVFFLTFLVLVEVVLRLRRRMSLVCQSCGFDPVLYRAEPSLAAAKVKRFVEQRKTDPHFLLKPALDLPKRRQTETPLPNAVARRENSRGKIISKSI